jgi:hypothetical protein
MYNWSGRTTDAGCTPEALCCSQLMIFRDFIMESCWSRRLTGSCWYAMYLLLYLLLGRSSQESSEQRLCEAAGRCSSGRPEAK